MESPHGDQEQSRNPVAKGDRAEERAESEAQRAYDELTAGASRPGLVYQLPGDTSERLLARERFLEAMDRTAPQVWEDLKKRTAASVTALRQSEPSGFVALIIEAGHSRQPVPPPASAEAEGARNAVRTGVLEWTDRYNLGDGWAACAAYERLSTVSTERRWSVPSSDLSAVFLPRAIAEIPPVKWDPIVEDEVRFRERVDNHVAAVKKALAELGARPNRERFYTAAELERLVRFQVLREPWIRIARSQLPKMHSDRRGSPWGPEGEHEQSRHRADDMARRLYELQEFLGLPRYRRPRGRPRKSAG